MNFANQSNLALTNGHVPPCRGRRDASSVLSFSGGSECDNVHGPDCSAPRWKNDSANPYGFLHTRLLGDVGSCDPKPRSSLYVDYPPLICLPMSAPKAASLRTTFNIVAKNSLNY